MSDEQYDQFLEEIQECLAEQRKQFVTVNYKRFIELSRDNDEVYKQFVNLIDNFQTCSQTIAAISNDIQELRESKEKCMLKLEQVQLINETNQEIDDIQAEDQLTEMIDNLASFTFEKNYNQAIDSYKLLKEMLQSEKYIQLLKKPEIERQIDQTYKGLCQSLFNDYINESPQFDTKQLSEYLLAINQVELVMQAFLQVQQLKFQDWVESQNQFDEKQLSIFMSNLVRINHQFEQLFQKQLRENQLLFGFISQFNSEITQIYFTQVCPEIFTDTMQFEDIFAKSSNILKVLIDKGQKSKGISLDFDVQKQLVVFIEQKIIELFGVFGQKVNQFLHFNENKLIKLEFRSNLLEGDKILDSPVIEIKTANKPQEIKVKSIATVKSVFEQLNQPMSISSAYFWNIAYKLGDSALDFFNPEEYPILSTQLNEIVGKLLIMFIKDYQEAMLKFKCSADSTGAQYLFQIGNQFGNFNLCNTLTHYLQNRAALLQFQLNNEWKSLISSLYEELRLSVVEYYRIAILEMLPFWIGDQGKVYGTNQNQNQRPSPLFLMIGYSICEVKNNFGSLIPKQASIYFLMSLWELIKYVIEYVLYWSYHNMGKHNEVFFLDKKSRDELQLDMNQINLYLQLNCLRISVITVEGMQQLIFDLMFIFELYGRFIGPIENDQFCKKLITLYCKEKKMDCNKFNLDQQTYKGDFENYFSLKFEKDMIQAKQFIGQQRKGVVN